MTPQIGRRGRLVVGQGQVDPACFFPCGDELLDPGDVRSRGLVERVERASASIERPWAAARMRGR